MLQDMRDAIQRANRVISELLEFSRPGELTLKPEDFHAIVDRALSLVKLEMTRHHIEVVRQFGAAVPALPMDKNKIEQVLVNIFMNADPSHAGGRDTYRPDLRRCPPAPAARLRLTVEIDDTGPGIPEASSDQGIRPVLHDEARRPGHRPGP